LVKKIHSFGAIEEQAHLPSIVSQLKQQLKDQFQMNEGHVLEN